MISPVVASTVAALKPDAAIAFELRLAHKNNASTIATSKLAIRPNSDRVDDNVAEEIPMIR